MKNKIKTKRNQTNTTKEDSLCLFFCFERGQMSMKTSDYGSEMNIPKNQIYSMI